MRLALALGCVLVRSCSLVGLIGEVDALEGVRSHLVGERSGRLLSSVLEKESRSSTESSS